MHQNDKWRLLINGVECTWTFIPTKNDLWRLLINTIFKYFSSDFNEMSEFTRRLHPSSAERYYLTFALMNDLKK